MKAAKETCPSVVIRKVIHAKREEVFDAWTKPELMQKWFFPGNWTAKTTNELKVGGKYSHDMIANGTSSPCTADGKPASAGPETGHNVHTGEYLEISRPERLVFTWNSWMVQNTRVTIELREIGSDTELTLTHELLETEDFRKRHAQGWEGCLANLMTFLG